MNKSVLIVICDFLLLSLLALARFDGPSADQNPVVRPPDNSSTAVGQNNDLVEVMKSALADERTAREKLIAEFSQTQTALQTNQQALAERDQRIQAFQENLRQKEQETRQLAAERSKLTEQFSTAQTTVENLQKQLASTSTEALLSKERLAAMQQELQKSEQQIQRAQQRMGELEKAQQVVQEEKQKLFAQLQVTEAEKRMTIDQLASAQTEKAKLQEQTTKLTEGVTALAEKSTELTQEIRENRPLAPNTIFNDFVANRIQSRFEARRSGVFGQEVSRNKDTKTIVISDGKQTFALYHVEETPLGLAMPGMDWESFIGILRRGPIAFSMVSMSLSSIDPRVLLVPIGEPQAKQLGSKVYPLAKDPFKFPEAVVIGADEGYYGEAAFRIDLETPGYIKMDRSLLKGLFGKFNPSRGDLVFSKSGELMGIMVNNEYCAVINNFAAHRTLRFGRDIAAQQTGQVMASMRAQLMQMPFRLQ